MEPIWRHEELELRYVFGRVRRHISSIILFTVVGLLVGFVYLLFAQPRYTAQTAMLLETETGLIGNVETLFLDLDTHANLVRSDVIVAEVVRRLSLHEVDAFDPKSGLIERMVNFTRDRFSQPLFGEVRTLEERLDEAQRDQISRAEVNQILARVPVLRKNLVVLRLGETRLLRVSFTSNEPELSAQIANTVAEVYIDHLQSISGQQMSSNEMVSRAEALGVDLSAEGTIFPRSNAGLFDDIRVVSWATVPTTHSTPNITIVMGIFMTLGFLAGIFYAVRKEWGQAA